MTTTRKTLLLGAGLVLTFANGVSASERTRAESGVLPAEDAVAAPVAVTNAREIAPGVGMATINGQDVKWYADGSVRVEEIEQMYGSIARASFEAQVQDVPSSRDSSGTVIYANGATGYFRDLLGSDKPKPAPATIEELKETQPWIERVVDGVTVISFADGSVFAAESDRFMTPPWVAHRDNVPNVVDENGRRIYADGAVFQEPLVQPTEGQ